MKPDIDITMLKPKIKIGRKELNEKIEEIKKEYENKDIPIPKDLRSFWYQQPHE